MTPEPITRDDWWNKGFDDYFDGYEIGPDYDIDHGRALNAYSLGWYAANGMQGKIRAGLDFSVAHK